MSLYNIKEILLDFPSSIVLSSDDLLMLGQAWPNVETVDFGEYGPHFHVKTVEEMLGYCPHLRILKAGPYTSGALAELRSGYQLR